MVYIVLTYTVMVYIVMAYTVMAYTGMAYTVMAYTVMAYIGMGYVGTAYIVMAYIERKCELGVWWYTDIVERAIQRHHPRLDAMPHRMIHQMARSNGSIDCSPSNALSSAWTNCSIECAIALHANAASNA